MSKIINNSIYYTVGNILPQAIGFILLPIYTKYLTPEDFGIVSSMQVLNVILTLLFTLAIDRSVYRLYFDYSNDKDKRDFIGTITISIFFISTTVLFIIFISNNLISQIYSSIDFYPFYVYVVLTAFFSVFSIIPQIYFQIKGKAGK